MDKIKVMSVFGTRPEAIKMAPLVKELESREEVESIVCVTAQHREMLDQVLEAFQIVPDYDLDIMEPSQTLMRITVKALTGLGDVLEKAKPDLVLVHGDTSTTFVAALASFYAKVKVGHVEAGLRTFDKYSPFPEEMNRTLTTDIADLHFAPTKANVANLHREGVEKNVYITGNTVIDALKTTVRDSYTFQCQRLNEIDYQKERVVLLTAHRREKLRRTLPEYHGRCAYGGGERAGCALCLSGASQPLCAADGPGQPGEYTQCGPGRAVGRDGYA